MLLFLRLVLGVFFSNRTSTPFLPPSQVSPLVGSAVSSARVDSGDEVVPVPTAADVESVGYAVV